MGLVRLLTEVNNRVSSKSFVFYLYGLLIERYIEFFNSHHPDPNETDTDNNGSDDRFPEGMFRFEKVMK